MTIQSGSKWLKLNPDVSLELKGNRNEMMSLKTSYMFLSEFRVTHSD